MIFTSLASSLWLQRVSKKQQSSWSLVHPYPYLMILFNNPTFHGQGELEQRDRQLQEAPG